MGRYVDWGDCTARYKSLAADRGAEVLSPIIDDAEGEIDARLAPTYPVPFVPGSSNAPQIVRTLAIDLTYYRCNFQQKWAKDLKAYIDARLDALASGSMALVTSGGVIVDPANVVNAWTSTPYRSSFGIGDPTDFTKSETWQQDQQDARDGD